jgi:AcrR family transcriptional regulator
MDPELIWLRPEKAGVGRPAQRSRREITEAAVRIADRSGLEAVSMRHVAAELGTGAGSLYRYVETRDDLLDLMADHVAAEYELAAPTGDPVADLVDLGLQAREIYRRHPWLVELVLARPVVGPHGVDVTEHVLAVLADHPAPGPDKLVTWAMLTAVVAAAARNELSPDDTLRSARYVAHVVAQGGHPHLAALDLSSATPGDPLPGALAKVVRGLLA